MKKVATFIIVVLAMGAGSFYGGTLYGRSSADPARAGAFVNLDAGQRQARLQQFGGQLPGGPGLRANGTSAVNGEVLSSDGGSLTIKLRDGGSKIVLTSSSTQVVKAEASSLADVAAGEQVMVFGSANGDGSITAQSIQVRPALPPTP